MHQELILPIRGERVALGSVRADLLALYTRWMNDFGMVRTKDDPPAPVTEDLYRAIVQAVTRDDAAWFTVYATKLDEVNPLRPIGITGLFDIDHRHNTAEFAIHIGETSDRGRGYGTETTRLVLNYAFARLNLHNVTLRAFAENFAGRYAYEKAGFRHIGTRREAWRMGPTLRDVVYMECLNPESSHDATSPS